MVADFGIRKMEVGNCAWDSAIADDSKKDLRLELRFGHHGGGCLKRVFDLGVCW